MGDGQKDAQGIVGCIVESNLQGGKRRWPERDEGFGKRQVGLFHSDLDRAGQRRSGSIGSSLREEEQKADAGVSTVPQRLLRELIRSGLFDPFYQRPHAQRIYRQIERPAQSHKASNLTVEQRGIVEVGILQWAEELRRGDAAYLAKRILDFERRVRKSHSIEQGIDRFSLADPAEDDSALPLDLLLTVPQSMVEDFQRELAHERRLPRRIEGHLRIERRTHQVP